MGCRIVIINLTVIRRKIINKNQINRWIAAKSMRVSLKNRQGHLYLRGMRKVNSVVRVTRRVLAAPCGSIICLAYSSYLPVQLLKYPTKLLSAINQLIGIVNCSHTDRWNSEKSEDAKLQSDRTRIRLESRNAVKCPAPLALRLKACVVRGKYPQDVLHILGLHNLKDSYITANTTYKMWINYRLAANLYHNGVHITNIISSN